jgi:hypothetical protein
MAKQKKTLKLKLGTIRVLPVEDLAKVVGGERPTTC